MTKLFRPKHQNKSCIIADPALRLLIQKNSPLTQSFYYMLLAQYSLNDKAFCIFKALLGHSTVKYWLSINHTYLHTLHNELIFSESSRLLPDLNALILIYFSLNFLFFAVDLTL